MLKYKIFCFFLCVSSNISAVNTFEHNNMELNHNLNFFQKMQLKCKEKWNFCKKKIIFFKNYAISYSLDWALSSIISSVGGGSNNYSMSYEAGQSLISFFSTQGTDEDFKAMIEEIKRILNDVSNTVANMLADKFVQESKQILNSEDFKAMIEESKKVLNNVLTNVASVLADRLVQGGRQILIQDIDLPNHVENASKTLNKFADENGGAISNLYSVKNFLENFKFSAALALQKDFVYLKGHIDCSLEKKYSVSGSVGLFVTKLRYEILEKIFLYAIMVDLLSFGALVENLQGGDWGLNHYVLFVLNYEIFKNTRLFLGIRSNFRSLNNFDSFNFSMGIIYIQDNY